LHLHLSDLFCHSDRGADFTGVSACLTGGFQVVLQSIVAAGAYRGSNGDKFQRLFVQWHGHSFLRMQLASFHGITSSFNISQAMTESSITYTSVCWPVSLIAASITMACIDNPSPV
jgi:hypothetical protein